MQGTEQRRGLQLVLPQVDCVVFAVAAGGTRRVRTTRFKDSVGCDPGCSEGMHYDRDFFGDMEF